MQSQPQHVSSAHPSETKARVGRLSTEKCGLVVGAVACFMAIAITSASTDPSVCSDPFGCFTSSPDFIHPILRPINLLPESAAKVNTTFYIYSKWLLQADRNKSANFPKACIVAPLRFDVMFTPCAFTTDSFLNDNQLGETLKKVNQLKHNQSTTGWTAIVVHGFLDSLHSSSSWMSAIKNGLLQAGPERSYDIVVLTDWTGGNGIPYLQATANTRLVGSQIAYFLQQLIKYLHVDIQKTHIIGHSLGAHIAAYAGEKFISPKIGQITALDPAGPNFEGMPKTVRLDRDDATLVDAIHTNAKPLYRLGYGMLDPVATFDFYPNGGLNQPGCDISALPGAFDRLMRDPNNLMSSIGQIGELVTCSHLRAIDYFVESITASECHFVSVRCENWSQYLDGNCTTCNSSSSHGCAPMGFWVYNWAQQMADTQMENSNQSHKFYLETNLKAPFCKQ